MGKVFLSYSRADSLHFARTLRRRFVRDGIDCFFDEASIEWGENFVLALENGLDECDHIIVVLSPAFVSSQWTTVERTSTTLDDPANLNRKFLPLLLRPCEPPRFLKSIQYIDVSTIELFEKHYPTICRKLGGTLEPDTPKMNFDLVEVPATDKSQLSDYKTVELVIDRNYDSWSGEDKNILLKAIGELLKLNEGDLRIRGERKGSVIITLEIRGNLEKKFQKIVDEGKLKQYGVNRGSIKWLDSSSVSKNEKDISLRYYVEELYSTNSLAAAFEALENRIRSLGYDSAFFVYNHPAFEKTDSPIRPVYIASKMMILDKFCDDWIDHHQTLFGALANGEVDPILWLGENVNSDIYMMTEMHEFIKHLGIQQVVTIPLYHRSDGAFLASFTSTQPPDSVSMTIADLRISTGMFSTIVLTNPSYLFNFTRAVLQLTLTKSEKEFLRLISSGRSPSEIEREEGVTKRHLDSLYRSVRRKIFEVDQEKSTHITLENMLYICGID